MFKKKIHKRRYGHFACRCQTEYKTNEGIIPVTVWTDPLENATTIHTCAVKQRTCFAPTGTDCQNRSLNLNLPALYVYP
jgi:hypothetical protein